MPVAADVVIVSVGVHNDDGKRRKFADDFAEVADAHAGVEKQSFVFAKDEIGDGFFRLMRFVDSDGVGRDIVDFKPGIGNGRCVEEIYIRDEAEACTTQGFHAVAKQRVLHSVLTEEPVPVRGCQQET